MLPNSKDCGGGPLNGGGGPPNPGGGGPNLESTCYENQKQIMLTCGHLVVFETFKLIFSHNAKLRHQGNKPFC